MNYKPDLSPEQKLDIVLQAVVNMSENDNLNYMFIVEMVKADGYGKEIFEILLKLMKDGYITSPHGGGHGIYFSNFDGRLFIDNGGYTEERNRRIAHEIIASQNEKRIIRNEKLLVIGTWFAGFAAAFLLLWSMWIWFYPIHKDYPYWIWETIPKKKP